MKTYYICIIVLMVLSIIDIQAQQVVPSNINPFSKLEFLNSPTDTITFIATYSNVIGKLSDNNADMLEVISRQSRENLKRFNFAIGFTLPGYPQKFYAPCKDKVFFKMASNNKNVIKRLRLNCLVYRFYYINGFCNFFRINKVSVVD
jgi:hypothetical protein